ncbi:hypothetical protein [Paenibacillus herberti]|uniref:ABC transporter permease n=1 Tax=Paenibacillus herberti TaxID=1619309 RepID=A0A229P0B0_9BACL|nr:hypothetical protein [Paenibacillus herberti]OXM15548.1 hypothetical protein CGZ75_02075 [Paenibacillus herberti]
MENISVGLKWVIGIIVTILIIAAGVSIYLLINGYFNRAQQQTLSQNQLISQAEFSTYDNKDVSGQDVINAATRYSGRPQFSVFIATGENEKGFFAKNNYTQCYAPPDSTSLPVDLTSKCETASTMSPVDVATMQDPTIMPTFVNTTAVFESKIYKDKNGEVRLVAFKYKK